MATPTLANGMQAVLQFAQEGQILQNVLNFIRFGGFTDEEVQSVAEDLISWWDTAVQSDAANNVTLDMVKARRLNTEDAPTFEVTAGLPLAGTHANPLPNSATVVLTLRTGEAGRSNRGRIYHVGLTSTLLDSGNPNLLASGGTTFLVEAYEALRDFAFDVTDTTLAVFSRKNESAKAVTAITCDGILDSQRRRLPGRGR